MNSPPPFVPDGQPLIFPTGTEIGEDNGTWALYVNRRLALSWVGYRTPGGTRILPLGGVRTASLDLGRIDQFVSQRQDTGCQSCD